MMNVYFYALIIFSSERDLLNFKAVAQTDYYQQTETQGSYQVVCCCLAYVALSRNWNPASSRAKQNHQVQTIPF